MASAKQLGADQVALVREIRRADARPCFEFRQQFLSRPQHGLAFRAAEFLGPSRAGERMVKDKLPLANLALKRGQNRQRLLGVAKRGFVLAVVVMQASWRR